MNIQLMQENNDKRMSSREIAELCDKRHEHVCRDIELVNKDYESEGLPKIGETYYYNEQNGQRYRQYELTEIQCLDLVSGYSRPLRFRINRRWVELERRAQSNSPVVTMPDFTNPVTAARAWADELEAKQVVQAQLTIALPKINHYDNVVERAGLLNATQVAQKVRLSAVAMNKILDELGVYNKAVKRSRVFQQWFIDKGLGEVKQTDQGFSQAMFTKRGEAWIVERLISEGVA
ncbi:Rha family transcriptional regulator [Psychrobacter immobilis]|uniref:Rha family transcriptional regulator n=1 Tax=Psychrobacter immobilis TaxID=498 RepID=UPI001D103597|nr:Rha family transcriptional regulator [Psychrobacter immobilis]